MVGTQFSLVVGLGKTGQSLINYLKYKRQPFVVYDTRENPLGLKSFLEKNPDVPYYLGSFPDSRLSEINTIYMSPGVSLDNPLFKKALAARIPILGDIACLSAEVKVPMIGITGTNGKSTVTTLVGEMAKAAGIKVAVGGNLGTPVLDLWLQDPNCALWVLELSSFQLDLAGTLSLRAATILNVTPDHLDRHHSLEAYIDAKQRIYHAAENILYNRQDNQTYPHQSAKASVMSFGLDASDDMWGILEAQGESYLAFGSQKIMAVRDLKIKGRHNWLNALAACALAKTVGISFSVMTDVLKHFHGLPHRAAWVRNIHGVDWIDDSKGTNVGATCSAISGIGSAMPGKVILIAGGQGKGADFRELREVVSAYVRSVILFGEDAALIHNALKDLADVHRVPDLAAAVRLAQQKAVVGDVVLLSPACASFDMFSDFNHRGDVFNELVHALEGA